MIDLLPRLQELEEEVKELRAILARLVVVGEVTEVEPKTHRVRVYLPGRQGMTTPLLPVLVPMSYRDKAYALPKKGDKVVVLSLPYGVEDAFVLGAFYTLSDTPPSSDENKHVVEFEDGTRVEYDKSAHRLSIDVPQGEVHIAVKGGAGNLYVNGHLIVSGQIYDLGKTKGSLDDFRSVYNSHTHTGDSGGTTSKPHQKV